MATDNDDLSTHERFHEKVLHVKIVQSLPGVELEDVELCVKDMKRKLLSKKIFNKPLEQRRVLALLNLAEERLAELKKERPITLH